MKIPVFIVEDDGDFAGAIAFSLETQEKYSFEIVMVNP